MEHFTKYIFTLIILNIDPKIFFKVSELIAYT